MIKTTEWHRHECMFEGKWFTLTVGWRENEKQGVCAIGTTRSGLKEIATAERCREIADLYTAAAKCIAALDGSEGE